MDSTDQGSDQAVTLADRGGMNEPQITLAVVGTGGTQDAAALHFNHESVNGALVLGRVETHAPDDLRAGLRSLLNQGGANGGANDGAEVHRSGVVN